MNRKIETICKALGTRCDEAMRVVILFSSRAGSHCCDTSM